MGVTHLLDTHTVLWALTNPTRLGRKARAVLTDRFRPIVVSAVSAWELSSKQRVGKLPQADAILGAYSEHLERLGATRMPITEDHALLAGRLDWQHRDPFDRMLAAQAMIESLTLITGDAVFDGLAGVRTVW
ncbi:type II toxin-antitoxin system VapC family toxin [Mycobacterium sp. AMU20-3851]|uniref:type II toxin-antitoxin system VapC family toxin n=1 Tax=Mycobacterium sp. AMU20-3851 TaxID=3122055 RepID=UPI0037546CC8